MSELLVKKMSETYVVRYGSSLRNPILRFLDMLRMIVLYRSQCSIVIIDIYSTLAFWYAVGCIALLRLLRIPYVNVLRGGNLPGRLSRSPRMSSFVFSNSRTNVGPSGYLAEELVRMGFRAMVIPNFITVTSYPFKLRTVFGPRILWVRSFHRIYNPEMAIRVVHRLALKYSSIRLLMIGPDKDGSLSGCKSLASELGLSEMVQFTGFLEKEQWIERSVDTDVFINTTMADNMPVSVVEAMALGLPVVSTNVGGIPFLLQDGESGYLVPPNDVDGMAHKIDVILSNYALGHKLALNARRVAEGFDWEVVRKKWIETLGLD